MFLRITTFQFVYQEFGLLFPSPVSLGIGPHTACNFLITHSLEITTRSIIFTLLEHNLPERIQLLISSKYSDFLTYLTF
jgi:hypothetical protein